MLRDLQGRTNDFLLATDGRSVPCGAFTYLVRDIAGVESFKVVQESITLTRISLVIGAGFDLTSIQALTDGFRRRLGSDVKVEIEFVAAVLAESTGKFRYITSKVASNSKHGNSGSHA